MIALLILLTAAMAAWGQPSGDGVPLLHQVADAWRGVRTWRVEGTAEGRDGTPFSPYERRPFFSSKGGRWESRYVFFRGYTVCDVQDAWRRKILSGISYYEDDYSETATEPACRPPFPRWEDLLDSLVSAPLEGKDGQRGCTLVKGTYNVPVPAISDLAGSLGFGAGIRQPVGLVTREVCVDEARKVVLWERFEGDDGSPVHVTLDYEKIELDPQFGADEFHYPDAIPESIRGKPGRVPHFAINALDALPVCGIGSRCVP
jgi:hypothetical protein